MGSGKRASIACALAVTAAGLSCGPKTVVVRIAPPPPVATPTPPRAIATARPAPPATPLPPARRPTPAPASPAPTSTAPRAPTEAPVLRPSATPPPALPSPAGPVPTPTLTAPPAAPAAAAPATPVPATSTARPTVATPTARPTVATPTATPRPASATPTARPPLAAPTLRPPRTATASPSPAPSATRAPSAAPALAAPPLEGASPAPSPTSALFSPLSGEWAFRARTGQREIGGSLRFGSEGGALAGTYVAPTGRATPLANLALNGELISFGITGSLGTWQLSGVVTGDRMSGTFETIGGVVPWTAERGTARPSPTPSAPAAFGRGVRSANRRPRERFA